MSRLVTAELQKVWLERKTEGHNVAQHVFCDVGDMVTDTVNLAYSLFQLSFPSFSRAKERQTIDCSIYSRWEDFKHFLPPM